MMDIVPSPIDYGGIHGAMQRRLQRQRADDRHPLGVQPSGLLLEGFFTLERLSLF